MEQPNRHTRWYEDSESLSGRVLTTLLFVDVADSTEHVVRLGDRAWADLLDALLVRLRAEVRRLGGREVDDAGDGLLVAFAGPSHAVAAALLFRDLAGDAGVDVRCGVHTGEVEVVNDRYRGLTVHVGARVAALAAPGEVLVTEVVATLLSGTDVRLHDRGAHRLKGVPRPYGLWSIEVERPVSNGAFDGEGRAAAVRRRSRGATAARGGGGVVRQRNR
ncbi:MAG: adenylate/guanylate cyclase domain-containing protein, partial [Actinomycetota bacterium]